MPEGQTHPVGQKQPNAFGRHEMSGNVWEWTASDYQAEYDGRAMASSTNSQSGWVFVTRARRALRGGSWGTGPALARVAYRGWNDPASRFVLLGFRLARD
jgi:formylglycine-generating enzyme required for sulfatase activity